MLNAPLLRVYIRWRRPRTHAVKLSVVATRLKQRNLSSHHRFDRACTIALKRLPLKHSASEVTCQRPVSKEIEWCVHVGQKAGGINQPVCDTQRQEGADDPKGNPKPLRSAHGRMAVFVIRIKLFLLVVIISGWISRVWPSRDQNINTANGDKKQPSRHEFQVAGCPTRERVQGIRQSVAFERRKSFKVAVPSGFARLSNRFDINLSNLCLGTGYNDGIDRLRIQSLRFAMVATLRNRIGRVRCRLSRTGGRWRRGPRGGGGVIAPAA